MGVRKNDATGVSFPARHYIEIIELEQIQHSLTGVSIYGRLFGTDPAAAEQ